MSEKVKQDVLAAARRVVRRHKHATMPQLAEGTGMSVRTLYRLFGNREALMRELGCLPEPPVREQILAVSLKMIGHRGFAELSMDDVAAAADVSRTALYRLFPGKPALFKGLIETYSPWEGVHLVIDAMPDGHPRDVIPAVARALATSLEGRIGLLMPMILEMVKDNPETREGMGNKPARGLADLVRYLQRQMVGGRLRRVDPIVAFQLFVGPIVIHLLTRPLAERVMSVRRMPVEEVIDQVAAAWLRSMLLSNDAPRCSNRQPSIRSQASPTNRAR
jgi:AcrR family transcriptional regulator